jgi:hypothetical protein
METQRRRQRRSRATTTKEDERAAKGEEHVGKAGTTEIQLKLKKLTVKTYYKHFLSVYGVLSAAVAGFPLLSKLLPEHWGAYLFPPLGDQGPPARVAAFILGALVTLTIYFSKDWLAGLTKKGRVWIFLALIAIALISLMAFFVLSQRFVRTIPIPSMKTEAVVSVGYERTPFALSSYGEATDLEILGRRGFTEEQIEKLWTQSSIIKARSGLFLSDLIFLLSAVAIGSLGVLFDKLGSPLES